MERRRSRLCRIPITCMRYAPIPRLRAFTADRLSAVARAHPLVSRPLRAHDPANSASAEPVSRNTFQSSIARAPSDL